MFAVFSLLKRQKNMKYLGAVILILFWGTQSILGFKRCEIAYERSPAADTEKIVSVAEEWDEYELFYIYEKFERYMSIADIQFLKPKLNIKVIQLTDFNLQEYSLENDNQLFILEKEGIAIKEAINVYDIVEDVGPFVILK